MDELILFKFVLDQTDDIVIITEIDPIVAPFGPKIIYVNKAFTILTGYTSEEVIGKTPRILQGKKTDKATLKKIREALEKKEAIHVELLNYAKDQSEYWLDFTIIPIKNNLGEVHYFAAIEHDITERKMLEDTQTKLSALVEFSGEAIVGKNLQGTIQSWNQAAEKLYGYSKEEAIGANIQMLLPKDQQDEFQNIINRIAKGESIKDFESVRLHKKGNLIPVSVTVAPIKNRQGDLIGTSTSTRDITQQKLVEEKLKHLAEHDPLTGLINRTIFDDRMQQAINLAKRIKCKMAICFIDIDDFKTINDTYGHVIGDLLLCKVATTITKTIRQVDTLARFGGDELALILSYLRKETDVIKIIEKIRSKFIKGFLIENHKIKVTLSIGIALYPKDGAHDLVNKADAAMYHVKKNGKNDFIFYRAIAGKIA